MNEALCLEGVSVAYGDVVAVRDVTLQVAPAEVHVLLGRSGSGKTTLLRAIAGFERVSTGSISLDGRLLDDSRREVVPPEQRGIGVVFQDYALFPHMDVAKNVAFGMKPKDDAQVRRLLELIDLSERALARPSELSGGEQQRVALARALASKPRLMLFDEPFSNLDPELRQSLRDETFEVVRRSGIAAILVTHSAREAMEVADRISVLHAGALVQTGTPQQVYTSPVHLDAARALGAVVRLPASCDEQGVVCALGRVERVHGEAPTRAVLIRPEAIECEVCGKEDADAEVLRTVFQGDHVIVHVKALDGGDTAVAKCAPHKAPKARWVRVVVRDAVWG
ncbi:MAG: ABC transporter ATP-binding protein [Myxococcota bacterium]